MSTFYIHDYVGHSLLRYLQVLPYKRYLQLPYHHQERRVNGDLQLNEIFLIMKSALDQSIGRSVGDFLPSEHFCGAGDDIRRSHGGAIWAGPHPHRQQVN